ncbi:TasA family protein [Clostridium sp. LIBA-8841]|uniref:TasA family protein n=1 Tax=Clostridium sp. LIBA-8841 TaxID=2987530 RepID=UPI002AC5658B|nr:TasA family protein [Clostridium sp. LIBA-8841]MDZ5254304.1 CalY family protein [Clostridium sp. LIBA-8841]
MKKKVIGMLLAGTLMVGAVGSYAWFTDQAKVNGDIKLTMGTLDVKVIDSERGWTVEDETSEILNKDNRNSFKNVRPGDTFARDFLVQNVGTLKQNVTVEINPELLNLELKDGITFDDVFNVSFSTELSPLALENDGKVTFELDSVETAVENEIGGYTDAKKVVVNLEVDPEAMGNEFNALGNVYKEVINLNNIKDADGNKIPLLVVDAQQVNK